MIFADDRFYLGLWFWNMPPGRFEEHPMGGDWLGYVWRPLDKPTDWNLRYRFRWYRDEKVFESDDRLSWYSGTLFGRGRDNVLSATHDAAGAIAATLGQTPDFLELDCRGREVPDKIMAAKKNWLHYQLVTSV